jgi:hypothetical protein
MQDHPTLGPRGAAPRPGSTAHRVQRAVLLELVTSPPPEGDDIGKIASSLDELRSDVEAAVGELIDSGLATRHVDTVRATPAALRFEALWPIRM